MNEIVLNAQLALFFDQPLDRPDQLITPFNDALGKVFDQVPMVVPVPKEPQLLTIPVVQMASTNGIFSCNIARSRVDLFMAGNGPQKFSDIKDSLVSKSEAYYNFFNSATQISRIGFVVRFFFPSDVPGEAISHLFNKDFIKIFEDGKVNDNYARYISRIKINDLDVNDFTSAERAIATIGSKQLQGILITRDFNTIPEKNYKSTLNATVIKNFINGASGIFEGHYRP